MATPGAPDPNPMDLDVTVISAKHLKNVNWRNGDLHPYATVWLDPDRRISTKPDDSGSTKPVWNESFALPLPSSASFDSLLLTLEIFHSKPSETPKPLVGTARVRLADVIGELVDSGLVHSLELLRPSGRPQGKVRVKIGIRERPPLPPPPSHPSPAYQDFNFGPQSGYYYSTAPPPPPPPQDYREYLPPSPYPAPPPPATAAPPTSYGYTAYSDPYPGYYPGYYSRPPPPPPRAFSGYTAPSGPSAPVDSSSYEQRAGEGSMGTVAGAMGGLSLDERGRYEEEKRGERVEDSAGSVSGRESFSDYRGKY